MNASRPEFSRRRSYVLITAAHNEEALIEKTIRSVISQSHLPNRWVIVSDGSTDGTADIVRKYSEQHSFIELLELEKNHKHNFAAQVRAINAGYERLRMLDFDFVGNADSDVSFEPSYFEQLLLRFEANPGMGLAGGFIFEEKGGVFKSRPTNTTRSVAHAVQLFRRQCYDEIGGYTPLRYGGPDWHAEVSARMRGWHVESFPGLPVFHHRPTGGSIGLLRYWRQQGLMDYSLGSDPVFEVLKCAVRVTSRPYVLGAFARLASFALAYFHRERRPVSDEFVDYLRGEQRGRIWPPLP